VVRTNATSPTTALGTALCAGVLGALVVGVAPTSQAAGADWQPSATVGSTKSAQKASGFKADQISNANTIPMKRYDVTASFGSSTGVHSWSGHKGVDLAGPHGQKVVSVSRGKVVQAGSAGAYGNLVKVKTSDGKKVLYAHLSSITVKKGDKIAAGDKIGREGTTGRSTGPHLHLELWNKKGNPINPVKYLGITDKQLKKAGR
jgi:murein DD-endopeptidase MepM/ murein hydrolase activator NlpD